MPTASFNALASLSAERLVNCAVEGILLALIAWCLLRVLGRENAGTRFAVWMATLLSIAALPLAGGLVPRHNAAGSGAVVAALTLSDRWGLYLFIAWAVIATVMLAKLVVGVWQLRRLRAESAEVAIAALDPLPRQTVEEFQTIRPVSIRISEAVSVPTAIGFLRPAVLLPAWTLYELSPADLNSVLLHELAHLRRRDDWTNLLQKVVRAIFFFSPAVWWIESRLTLEREMACDEHVLATNANPRAYAECLVNLAEKGYLQRAVLLAQGAVHRLRQCSLRVARILDSSQPGTARVPRLTLAAVGVSALSCLMLLGHVPSLVAFRAETPSVVAQAHDPTLPTPAMAVRSDEPVSRPAIVAAAWHPDATAVAPTLSHSADKLAHKRAPVEPAQQLAVTRSSAEVPLHRAALKTTPPTPTTLLLVTERSFYAPDGSQFCTVSVYRLTVLPGRDGMIFDEHIRKRI